MAEATATARGSTGTLDAAHDSPTRTFKTYEEVAEAVRIDRIRAGVKRKPNADVINNVCRLVMELQKWKASGGDGTISSGQLIGAMYDDVGETFDERKRKRGSIQRWMQCAQRIGAIRYEPLPGKSRGWRYELLPVSELAGYAAQTRRGSSAGETSLFARRRETRGERRARRVAPWRRTAGRRGVGRLVWAEDARPGTTEPLRPLFSASEVVSPRAEGDEIPLRGSLSPSAEEGADARMRGAAPPAWLAALDPSGPGGAPWGSGGRARDAIERACPPGQLAALRALRSSGLRAGGLEPLRRAADLAGPEWALAFALAAWAVAWGVAGHPGREPRLSRRMAEQLDRETGEAIGTLAYYAVALKASARHLRRQRRGAPAPRRHRPRGRR